MEVAETAQATAQAAHALTQLSVLLSSQGLLFGKAARHTVRQGAAVKAAGQESSVWSGGAAASPLQARSPSAISSSIQCQSVPTPCQSVPTPSLTHLFTHIFICSFMHSIHPLAEAPLACIHPLADTALCIVQQNGNSRFYLQIKPAQWCSVSASHSHACC